MWSMQDQKHHTDDIDMVAKLVYELNCEFDYFDMYHHSSAGTEMFEFNYSCDSHKRERWDITFMGKVVANSGGSDWEKDYDDYYEDGYLFLEEANRDKIYEMCYNGAIGVVTDMLQFMAFANIEEKHKQLWKDLIDKGINKVKDDNEKQGRPYKE